MNDSKKIDETSSGEVINGFRSCRDLSDVVPLYIPRGLYLKPIAKVNVSVNLPQLKVPGKTISTWEVMEKIRTLIQPDEFSSLKVAKSTLEFIRLEGDLKDRCRLQRVLARLDSQRLNLAGFPNVLKVRAAEAKDDFPNRHSWDSYFRDAKHMNELKPGERPDTIHITGLPAIWFSEDKGSTPSESLITKVFKKWGTPKRVDVPAADSYRSRMRLGTNIQKFSYGDGLFFDAYVQYVEYMDFVRAMDALRGMKLLKKESSNYLTAAIKVDFDKTKHMSDSAVAHREFERKRLVAQDGLAAEKLRKKEEIEERQREEQRKKEEAELTAKEIRRRKREEKRKRKALTVFRKQEEDKVSMKIAREEQKLIKAQRQLESIRLLDELFDRIKIKVERKEIEIKQIFEPDSKKDDKNVNKVGDNVADQSNINDEKKKAKKDRKLKKKKSKKEKNRKKKNKKDKESRSDDDADSANLQKDRKKFKKVLTTNVTHPSSSSGFTSLDPSISYPIMYPRFPQPWYYEPALPMLYPPMARGGPRNRFPRGRGRGYHPWRGGIRPIRSFNPHLYNEQYYKYFAKLAGQDYESDYDRSSKSRSRSRRKSNSWSRSRSRSRGSRRSSRRYNRNSSRSRSRSRRRSKTRSVSRSRSTPRLRSRSPVRNSKESLVRDRNRDHVQSRSNSRSRSSSRTRFRRRKRSGRSASKVKVTRARSRTVSSKQRSRSSSWSLPKSPDCRSCSWSKSVDTPKKQQEDLKKTDVNDKNQPSNGDLTQIPAVSQMETITPD